MLLDLVEERLIRLNIEATSPEDAIKKAAFPLIQSNKITDDYVNNIIANMHEVGPYFVICPHVALPHATTNQGVLSPAIGITTLNTPIAFGSKTNDPVKYMFTLAAPDNTSHLSALADLAELLEDEAFFNLLDTAITPQEVIDYLKKSETNKDK